MTTSVQGSAGPGGAPAGSTGSVGRGALEAGTRAAGQVEAALAALAQLEDPEAVRRGEALVRALSDLYGAALAQVVAVAAQCRRDGPGDCLSRLADDELVGSLLVLHELHPSDLEARVRAAVRRVGGLADGTDCTVLDVDGEAGRVRVRLLVGPGSLLPAGTVEQQVRRAVLAAAPEVTDVVVERPPAPTPVRLAARR